MWRSSYPQAADIHGARPNGNIKYRIGERSDKIAVVRGSARANNITRFLAQLFTGDCQFLIEIRFQRHTPLLHHHRTVMLLGIVRYACTITAHGLLQRSW